MQYVQYDADLCYDSRPTDSCYQTPACCTALQWSQSTHSVPHNHNCLWCLFHSTFLCNAADRQLPLHFICCGYISGQSLWLCDIPFQLAPTIRSADDDEFSNHSGHCIEKENLALVETTKLAQFYIKCYRHVRGQLRGMHHCGTGRYTFKSTRSGSL